MGSENPKFAELTKIELFTFSQFQLIDGFSLFAKTKTGVSIRGKWDMQHF